MRPASVARRISVCAGYERNPVGHLSPGSGGGHNATLPIPLIVIDASTGSPTRVLSGSICRSRLSFSPTTFVAGLAGGEGYNLVAVEMRGRRCAFFWVEKTEQDPHPLSP